MSPILHSAKPVSLADFLKVMESGGSAYWKHQLCRQVSGCEIYSLLYFSSVPLPSQNSSGMNFVNISVTTWDIGFSVLDIKIHRLTKFSTTDSGSSNVYWQRHRGNGLRTSPTYQPLNTIGKAWPKTHSSVSNSIITVTMNEISQKNAWHNSIPNNFALIIRSSLQLKPALGKLFSPTDLAELERHMSITQSATWCAAMSGLHCVWRHLGLHPSSFVVGAQLTLCSKSHSHFIQNPPAQFTRKEGSLH